MAVFLYRIVKTNGAIANIFVICTFLLLLNMPEQVASRLGIAYETGPLIQMAVLLDLSVIAVIIIIRVGVLQKTRQEATKLVRRNLKNEALLKEVHHRMKNNLQMITSLLNTQCRKLQNEQVKKDLAVTRNRVLSIGLIHEHLYKREDFSQVNLKEYVSELSDMLVMSLNNEAKIAVRLNIVELKVDFETAISIGLILNELMTNSLKHAFKEHSNPIFDITMREENEELIIYVGDNGPGMNLDNNQPGVGLSIINSLLESLSGSVESIKVNDGFHVLIRIKDYECALE